VDLCCPIRAALRTGKTKLKEFPERGGAASTMEAITSVAEWQGEGSGFVPFFVRVSVAASGTAEEGGSSYIVLHRDTRAERVLGRRGEGGRGGRERARTRGAKEGRHALPIEQSVSAIAEMADM